MDLLYELIQDHKEQNNLKKIESLEKKLINNMDENSYSELIKLKSQLNRNKKVDFLDLVIIYLTTQIWLKNS